MNLMIWIRLGQWEERKIDHRIMSILSQLLKCPTTLREVVGINMKETVKKVLI